MKKLISSTTNEAGNKINIYELDITNLQMKRWLSNIDYQIKPATATEETLSYADYQNYVAGTVVDTTKNRLANEITGEAANDYAYFLDLVTKNNPGVAIFDAMAKQVNILNTRAYELAVGVEYVDFDKQNFQFQLIEDDIIKASEEIEVEAYEPPAKGE